MNSQHHDPLAATDSADTSTGDSAGVTMGDTSSVEALLNTARSSRDNFLFGDDRAIVNPPNWHAQTSTQLYNSAVQNNDPGSAEELAQGWKNAGDALLQTANTLYEAISQLSGVWVGEASGTAQGALVGIANANNTAGDAAMTMGQRMSEQATAAAEAKAKMPPPMEFDVQQELSRILTDHPAAMALEDLRGKAAEAQNVQNTQQRIMDIYTKQLSGVDQKTPDFGPESIGMKPVGGSRYGAGSGLGTGAPAAVSDAGPSLSDVVGKADAPTPAGVDVGAVAKTAGDAVVGKSAPIEVDVRQPGTQGPIALTGSAPVTTSSTGSGAGAAIGMGALGAGVGLAGAKALAKSKNKRAAAQQPEPAAPAGDDAAAASADAPSGAPAGSEAAVPGAAAAAPAGSAAVSNVADLGAAPVSGAAPDPAVATSAGTTAAAAAAEAAQPAEGAVTAAADPSAVGKAAATDPGAATSGQPTSAAQSQAGPAGSPAGHAASGMPAGPMAPMGGTGAGAAAPAAAGGAGAAGGDRGEESYLIQPDPDDVFGPDEAVTSGVIGEFDEED